MSTLGYILLFTIISSVASLVGGILLLWNEKLCKRLTPFFVAFAAGTLLTVALIDLIPEALEEAAGEPKNLFLAVLFGILSFFLLERYIFWHHHHYEHEHVTDPTTSLIIIGDTVHNFLDGIAIAASFLVSIPVGIATSIAVGLHEIPQEIGDFGALLALDFKRGKVLLVNFISAFSALAGAVLGFYFLGAIETLLPYLLAFTGGHFVYIAASDLIPKLNSKEHNEKSVRQTLTFLFGIVVTYLAIVLLE